MLKDSSFSGSLLSSFRLEKALAIILLFFRRLGSSSLRPVTLKQFRNHDLQGLNPTNIVIHKHIFGDGVLLEPCAFPNENCGLGPHPGAHGYARAKHGEKINLLHKQAGSVLDDALRNFFLVAFMGYCHIGFTSIGKAVQMRVAWLRCITILHSYLYQELGFNLNSHRHLHCYNL